MTETTKKTDMVADGAMPVVPTACEFSGLSRTKLFQLMGEGKIKYIMGGRRRLILKRSLVEYMASLVK